MTAAIILAAGQSSRMGRPKALLEDAEGAPFVQRLATEARTGGLTPVVIVGRVDDHAVRTIAAASGTAFVANPHPERGQLSSLICAIESLAAVDVDAVVVLPVDVPGVRSAVIETIVRAAATSRQAIVRAVHRSAHGHPVLFKRALFDELRNADPHVGARAVVRADPARVLDVEVDDPRVLIDVDTPDDYARFLAITLSGGCGPRVP